MIDDTQVAARLADLLAEHEARRARLKQMSEALRAELKEIDDELWDNPHPAIGPFRFNASDRALGKAALKGDSK